MYKGSGTKSPLGYRDKVLGGTKPSKTDNIAMFNYLSFVPKFWSRYAYFHGVFVAQGNNRSTVQKCGLALEFRSQGEKHLHGLLVQNVTKFTNCNAILKIWGNATDPF